MVGTWRHIEVGIDASIAQVLDKCLGSEVLLGTTAQVQVVYLLVELIGTREHTVVGSIHIESEDGSAKRTHVRELIHVIQHNVEGLVTSPGQSSHSTMVAVGLSTEVIVDIGDEVV